ncbi:digestive cysteine proteinase 1-like [Colossoma macropomum]|uniref:digestive cysteine proteinase 1-like n=1 Tax=Colossoma macropomum TaxID=42526 RepID=UPI0018651B29|nr:digestive cysteine proteinase 1-like [Colossoma macropomum]
MGPFLAVAALLGCASVLEASPLAGRTLPDFGNMHHVKGVISLPYAEIKEPFEAWYDLEGKRSRIDYYHGQVCTFQLGTAVPQGVSYKVTPVTTETEFNAMKCFQVNGTKEDPVLPQAALPNVQGFQFEKMDYYAGVLCEVWKNITIVGHKKNTYRLWVTRPEGGPSVATPHHYEMMGYNTLLGSHYDKYLIDYSDFSPRTDPKDFNLPDGMDCGPFPGPGAEHRLLANPIQDLIHTSPVGHAHRLFGHFKEKYQRDYETEEEHEKREHNFVHNIRYVHSMNRAGLSFSLSVNHLADHSQAELAVMRGRRRKKTPNNAQSFPTELRSVATPDSLDWRLYGAVTPVKDQAVCGSCWSFATTGALEGALFLKTGEQVILSQQMLVDCTWGFGNNGCDGGEEWRAYEWIMKHGGISTAESYGGYTGMNGLCHYNSSSLTARVRSYTNVTSGDVEALKAALFKNGPTAVSIDASHRSFTFYSNGVYYEPACKNGTDDLDHAVLAVGYGVLDNQPYWLVKNSWSTYWGNDGYVLMSMKDNNCGVATDATYVTLA